VASLEDTANKLRRNQSQVRICFSTQAGQDTLALLKDLFIDQALFDADPYVTAHNVGKHDVVKFIIDLAELPNEHIT